MSAYISICIKYRWFRPIFLVCTVFCCFILVTKVKLWIKKKQPKTKPQLWQHVHVATLHLSFLNFQLALNGCSWRPCFLINHKGIATGQEVAISSYGSCCLTALGICFQSLHILYMIWCCCMSRYFNSKIVRETSMCNSISFFFSIKSLYNGNQQCMVIRSFFLRRLLANSCASL